MEYTFLEPYFKGRKRHAAYRKTVEIYNNLRLHANGEKPDKLLSDYRPSESDEIYNYRMKIYEPVTKEHISQIISSLSKIRRSSDWSIRHVAATDIPAVIRVAETPEKYCEENFPYHGSLSNWAFTVLLKNYLIDPNAVVLMLPTHTSTEAHEYLQPVPVLFNSDQVLELEENELVVLRSKEQCAYRHGNSVRYDGDVFYVADKQMIYRYEQGSAQQGFVLAAEWQHGLERLPAFRVRGAFYEAYDNYMVYESRISPIVPRLNKVVREDSDLDAAKVTHLYPETWEYATQLCDACYDNNSNQSKGYCNKNGTDEMCAKCGGTGRLSTSGPFRKLVVRQPNTNLGETAVPTPPKGYIDKPVEIIKIQDEIIDKNAYKALASINMQFLLQTPLSQSGYAKEIDRDELNNFVYAVAEDLVHILDQCYWFIIHYRYKLVLPDSTERNKLLPRIAVPEKFDILSLRYLLDEIVLAIEKNLHPALLQTMLIEFVSKKFYTTPELRDLLVCSLRLDPMPCVGENEKVLRKQNGGITEIDYIISCNATVFVQRAINEHADFYRWPLDKQFDQLKKYANEVQAANNA